MNDKSVKLEINEQKRVFNFDLYFWNRRHDRGNSVNKKKSKLILLFSHGSVDLRVN